LLVGAVVWQFVGSRCCSRACKAWTFVPSWLGYDGLAILSRWRLILVFECRFLSSGTASWPLRTRCWHPAPRAAARMLLASLLTPWTDVLLLLLLTLAAGQPACCTYRCLQPCCRQPAASAAARMLLASLLTPWMDVLLLLLLTLAAEQSACCIVAFGRR